MEWKLFEGEPPEATESLAGRGWMDLEGQPGFAQRSKMVADLVRFTAALTGSVTVTDLGCGDGSLLAMLPTHLDAWGYELGGGDVAHARSRGLDVRQADILSDQLEYGRLLSASEVLEHLADPVAFLKSLPRDPLLIASSPSAETGIWHNAIHAWAWDLEGYRDLLERGGYRVLYQTECDGGENEFGGVTGRQRFQAIVGAR